MKIEFYDPLNQRMVDTPYARLSEEETRQLDELRQVRGQVDNIFRQAVTVGGVTTQRNLIQGDGGQQIGFCSRSLDDPVFGAITDDDRWGGITDDRVHKFTVTLPPEEEGGEGGTLVQVAASDFIPVEGNTITLSFDSENGLSINGVVIAEEDWKELGAGSRFYTPAIKTTTPGVYTISALQGDVESAGHSGSYLLRKLEFQEEFPEFPSEPEGPIEIQNSFGWSDESPAEGARWTVEEKDGDTAVQGEGTEILATWKPDERTFAAQTTEDFKYEDVPLQVLARADSYLVQGNPVPYQISSEFDVPGAEQFQIVNERVTTENPFEEPGEPVEVQADVVVIGLDDIVEDDIEWFVSIKDPEGNIIPELEHFATGFGPEIVAEWDGTKDGVLVEEPLAHSFFLEARYCEDDGGGVILLRGTDGVRGQETEPETPGECRQMADSTVSIDTKLVINDIRFRAGQPNSGPYSHFEWRRQHRRLNEGDLVPHWFDRAGYLAQPLIFKTQPSILVDAQLGGNVLAQNLGSVAGCRVLLKARLDGETIDVGEVFLTREELVATDYHNDKLSFELRGPFQSVGRHRFQFDWEIRLLNSAGNIVRRSTMTTPKTEEEAHMLYTVFDEPLSLNYQWEIVNPDRAPWFNSQTFQDTDDQAKLLSSTSPLDQVTALCEGATTKQEAVSRLIQEFYTSSGSAYTSSTNVSDIYFFKNRIKLRHYLEKISRVGPKIECPQTATYLQILLAFIGIDSSTRDFEAGMFVDGEDPQLWTNYIRPVQPQSPPVYLRYSSSDVYPSKSVLPVGSKQSSYSLAQGDTVSPFGQVMWDFHQVLIYGNRVYDASLRFSSSPGNESQLNQDFFLNQLNITQKMQDRIPLVATQRGVKLPTGFFARSASRYDTYRFQQSNGSIVQPDHALFQNGMDEESYLNRLLYLRDSPELRYKHGYIPQLVKKNRNLLIDLGGQQ